MNNKIIWILIGLIIVLAGAFLLLDNNANKSTQTAQNPNASKTQVPIKPVNVTVTSKGFEPQTVTVKKGQRVVWINKSGTGVSVNSDVHPTHRKWPFLNLGNFDDGSNVSVVFEKAGEYTYHNNNNPSQTGTVVVE